MFDCRHSAWAAALRSSGRLRLERFAAAWLAITLALAIVGGRSDYPIARTRSYLPAHFWAGRGWRGRSSPRWREPLTYIIGAVAVVPFLAALVASLPALRNSQPPTMPVLVAGLAGFAGTVIGGPRWLDAARWYTASYSCLCGCPARHGQRGRAIV